MENRKAAERIRPILEAMERSIDRARSQRTRCTESPPTGDAAGHGSRPSSFPSATQKREQESTSAPRQSDRPIDPDIPRMPDGTPMKARPKRPQNLVPPPLASPYRSAG